MRTKAELLAALEESREGVVGGLDGVDLSSGVYEGGWNGRQLLAHIASMEWTYPGCWSCRLRPLSLRRDPRFGDEATLRVGL